MNDRYLFKAITLDTKQWIEGCLYYDESGTYIKRSHKGGRFGCGHLVNPNTVCAFTTLTDKNGERIWEQDFVRTPTGATFVIKWVQKHGEQGIIAPGYLTYGWEPGTLEVIRNIYDTHPQQDNKTE